MAPITPPAKVEADIPPGLSLPPLLAPLEDAEGDDGEIPLVPVDGDSDGPLKPPDPPADDAGCEMTQPGDPEVDCKGSQGFGINHWIN